MKKLTLARRLVASILAATTLASTTAAFAETVVYEDSFETSNGATTGLYVSMPEIRTYGENLIKTGFNRENIATVGTGISAISGYKVTVVGSQEQSRGDGWSVKATPTSYDRGAFVWYNVDIGGVEAGIYEFEGWLYTDIEGLNIDITNDRYNVTTDTTAFAALSEYGCEKGTATLKANEWTYIKATFSFPAANTAKIPIHFLAQNGWYKPGTTTPGVLYIDDVKFRKVTNAALTTDAEQAGMPVYSTSAISGQTATARVFAANTTNTDKTFQLISAVYDADGRYVSAIVNEPIRVPANSSKAPYTVDFEVPVLEEGQYIKSFTWDSIANPVALGLTKNYSDANYLLRDKIARNAPIPYMGGKWYMQASDYTTAHGTDRIVNGIAKTGVSSFLISGNDAGGQQSTIANFPVTAGHTYKIEYYVNYRNYCQDRADGIVGYAQNKPNKNGSNVVPASKAYNGTDTGETSSAILHPTTNAAQNSANLTAGEWIKVELTYAVPSDCTETSWCYYFTAPPNRALGSTYRDQMYIDDFKVTDITN